MREVLPDGIIRAIAGDGRSGWAATGMRARAAPVGGPSGLARHGGGDGLVVSAPRGTVYATSGQEAMRLRPSGTFGAVVRPIGGAPRA